MALKARGTLGYLTRDANCPGAAARDGRFSHMRANTFQRLISNV